MKNTSMVAGALLSLCSLVPAGALANDVGSDAQRVRDHEPRADRPTRWDPITLTSPTLAGTYLTHAVHTHYTRGLANGCMYVADITGQINSTRNHRIDVFSPRLTVDARVECNGHVVATAPLAHVRGHWITQQQLEYEIQRTARVFTPSVETATCAYTPVFFIDHGNVQGNDVSQVCNVARGGGPVVDTTASEHHSHAQ